MNALEMLEKKIQELVVHVKELQSANKELKECNNALEKNNVNLEKSNMQLIEQIELLRGSETQGISERKELTQEKEQTKIAIDNLIQNIDLLVK
jgi:FtsZ-binding cell division protein ZapB